MLKAIRFQKARLFWAHICDDALLLPSFRYSSALPLTAPTPSPPQPGCISYGSTSCGVSPRPLPPLPTHLPVPPGVSAMAAWAVGDLGRPYVGDEPVAMRQVLPVIIRLVVPSVDLWKQEQELNGSKKLHWQLVDLWNNNRTKITWMEETSLSSIYNEWGFVHIGPKVEATSLPDGFMGNPNSSSDWASIKIKEKIPFREV